MITVRKADERGHADHGWLDTRHSFSFAEYYDPSHMHFQNLRVLNEDRVAPGAGFGTHPHNDMEIVTYVVDGALEHRDSMGNSGVIGPGEVQRISAGTGVTHSEFNHSQTDPVHFLQIWIFPERKGIEPEYQQKAFSGSDRHNQLQHVVSGSDGADGALSINQDVEIYVSLLDAGQTLTHPIRNGRHAWLQLIRGRLAVNNVELGPGDGAAASAESQLEIACKNEAEFLLLDLG